MLTIDPRNPNKILYKGVCVGEVRKDGDREIVTISLTYEASADDWVGPLALLSQGLARLEPPRPPEVLRVQLGEHSLEPPGIGRMMLLEKALKAGGYTWIFHKSDMDPWPSPVHGHDYEHDLVLDAVTGQIFETADRTQVGKLRKKELSALQKTIKANKDLKAAAAKHLP